ADIRKETDDTLMAVMVRRGWGKILDPRYGGAVYIPPGQVSGIPESGFLSPEEVKVETEKDEAELDAVVLGIPALGKGTASAHAAQGSPPNRDRSRTRPAREAAPPRAAAERCPADPTGAEGRCDQHRHA